MNLGDARDAVPNIVDEEIVALERVIGERADRLQTPEYRDGLMAELIRLYRSARWRIYLAVNAACVSIADDDTRPGVRAALAQSEQAHVRAMAKVFELLAGLVGYRLLSETGTTNETLAHLNTAALHGLITMAISDPAVATQSLQAASWCPIETTEWSLSTVTLASSSSALFEPNPEIDWEAERARTLREGGWHDPGVPAQMTLISGTKGGSPEGERP